MSTKKYRESHKDYIKEWKRIYHQKNKEKLRKKHKEYYSKNKERIQKSAKKYHQEHKKEAIERATKWQQDHRKQYNERSLKYYYNHKKEHRRYVKEWQIAHPEKIKAIKKKADQNWKKNHYEDYLLASKRHQNKRKRNLGFNPINQYFPNSDGHHIDYKNVVYIPHEIHKAYPHNPKMENTMIKINIVAWAYLEASAL